MVERSARRLDAVFDVEGEGGEGVGCCFANVHVGIGDECVDVVDYDAGDDVVSCFVVDEFIGRSVVVVGKDLQVVARRRLTGRHLDWRTPCSDSFPTV